MKAEFSEFSYGFALSYEIMNALQPDIAGAPLFPSLLEESQKGYDVSFEPVGWLLFLQFKLADYMKTPRAKYWSHYDAPFFRVAIHKRKHSDQHNLLRALSAIESEAYYAAPAFYRQDEFNEAFVSNRIFEDSMFIPLRELPDLTDDEQHHITYRGDVLGFRWHSDRSTHFRISVSGSDWAKYLRRLVLEPRELGERFFIALRDSLVGLIRERTLQPRLFHEELPVDLDDVTPLAVIRDLRYLLMAYFGVETIILRPKK